MQITRIRSFMVRNYIRNIEYLNPMHQTFHIFTALVTIPSAIVKLQSRIPKCLDGDIIISRSCTMYIIRSWAKCVLINMSSDSNQISIVTIIGPGSTHFKASDANHGKNCGQL